MRGWFRLIVCASLMASPTLAQGQQDGQSDYAFDPDGYVRLRAQMDFVGTEENVFSARYCPEDELLGFEFDDLVKGSKTAALTVNISAPLITNTELNLYNIQTKKKLFGRSCEASFERIDFKSPLYLGGQYDGTTISVTPKLLVAEKPSDLFAVSLSSLVGIANAFSPLPAPFLANKDKYISRASGQFSSSLGVRDTVQLNVGSNGRNEETWTIPGNARKGVPTVRLRVYLENVPSYFSKPGSGWNAAGILARNFPSGAQFGFVSFGDMAQSLGPAYTNLVAASDLGSFNANCLMLQSEIGKQGFSPMDRSLLLWAVTRNQVNMREDPLIDSTQCLSAMFQELARLDSTKDIKPRPLPSPDPEPVVKAHATENQMRATVEFDSRLAVFWKTASWSVRRSAAERLFAWPLHYADSAATGLMGAGQIDLANPDQWQTRYSGTEIQFAQQLGCYLFRPSSGNEPSEMLALGTIGSGGSEVVLKIAFADVTPEVTAAPITRVELLAPEAARNEVASLRAVHGASCGQSWRPATLN